MTNNSIFAWAEREFKEEVNYSGTFTITSLGILNDDSNEVGKVHVGFVLLITGDSADISIKSELKSGTLMTLEQCRAHHDAMETWSQIVYDFLDKGSKQ